MSKTTKLTKRQRAVLDDLFVAELDEQKVLDKHGVSRAVYHRWLAEERFAAALEQRIVHSYRQSRVILARGAAKAADNLIGLAGSEKGETARKACLDIISLHSPDRADAKQDPAAKQKPGPPTPQLSPETASRLLAALAQEPCEEKITP
ncbi:MAG: hypothetical protein JW741_02600 [Sedimentisphaerales bacterium]|nr:hypothetical protein [Sedimentisphaerales bacterium]